MLLGPDGPRVIDFGIARTLDMSLTKTGEVAGTPSYMAPEVFTGRRAGPAHRRVRVGAVFAATGLESPVDDDHWGRRQDLHGLPHDRVRTLLGLT